jgi:hypothetical protein
MKLISYQKSKSSVKSGAINMKQSIAADGKHLFQFDRNDKSWVVIYMTNICKYFEVKYYPSIRVKTNLFFEVLDKFHQKVTA